MDKMKLIESMYAKKDVPEFKVGDTVKVMVKLVEADGKERLHPFEGVVIAKGSASSGSQANFTVRRVSYGEGVERVFPINSPSIARIEVVRSGKVRRAKLYYLRKKIGKRATKIEEQEEK